MSARVRLYDVEPKLGRSTTLPPWTQEFALDVLPAIGDEMKIIDEPGAPNPGETHFWRVVRSTCEPSPHRSDIAYILGVRFVT